MNALKEVVAAWRSELGKVLPKVAAPAKTRGSRPNPWPKCPSCFHRVPALCTTAPEGAEPCGFGIGCGCCTGPHRPPKRPEAEAT